MKLAILGAGCSGSSLACALIDGGFAGEIHIFDSRTDFSHEQRWCSWGPLPAWLAGLVSASWSRWSVVRGGEKTLCSLPERPYLHVYAPDFYRAVHERLRKHPNVHLHLGSAVRSVLDEGDERGPQVVTENGTFGVDFVFDSRAPSRPAPGGNGGEVSLHQSFLGFVVDCEEPVFDPQTVTLMDFGGEATSELSFVYVLPFSESRALVESTTFSERVVPEKEHLGVVEGYLDRLGAASYSFGARESGDIPMTTARPPERVSGRHVMIGVAGGATRPSSGYAFVQILRQSEALAEALIKGEDLPGRRVPRKYDVLDAIFLDAIRSSPALARESFARMFGRVPPDALVRFLAGESTLRDDALMVRALPKSPLIRAAMRRMKARARRLK